MTRREAWAVLADLVCVLFFVLLGRATHGEGEGPLDVLNTLWPFVGGLLVGWLILHRRALEGTKPQAGVVAGVYAAVGGLALRGIAGQGVALSFAIVAVGLLTVLMLGWRVVLRLSGR